MTEAYRVGRHLGRTIYQVTDGDEDKFIGIMDTPDLGAQVVAALNDSQSWAIAALFAAAEALDEEALRLRAGPLRSGLVDVGYVSGVEEAAAQVHKLARKSYDTA